SLPSLKLQSPAALSPRLSSEVVMVPSQLSSSPGVAPPSRWFPATMLDSMDIVSSETLLRPASESPEKLLVMVVFLKADAPSATYTAALPPLFIEMLRAIVVLVTESVEPEPER